MGTQQIELAEGAIAFDERGGHGPPIVMLPGAGDVRAEYRFLADELTGARVVTTDLRGHGDSSAGWPSYGMIETAGDLVALIEHLGGGPATVVATSFSPTAALWAAADRPDLIDRLVLISAHLDAPATWERLGLGLAMRGPLAGRLWASQFRTWHPGAPPSDLDEQCDRLADMLRDAQRRRAVRETLTAHRDGLDDRLGTLRQPILVVMGGADSHFEDPSATGASIAARTGGTLHLVPDAGHYPHVENPGQVATAIAEFLAETSADERS